MDLNRLTVRARGALEGAHQQALEAHVGAEAVDAHLQERHAIRFSPGRPCSHHPFQGMPGHVEDGNVGVFP